MANTDYVVLRRDENDAAEWTVLALGTPAHSAEAACRLVAESSDTAGVYVAVPVRSWNPSKQSKQTTTTWRTEPA